MLTMYFEMRSQSWKELEEWPVSRVSARLVVKWDEIQAAMYAVL